MRGAVARDGGDVEGVIAALDAEVGLEGFDFGEGLGGAFGGGELGLAVGVGEEDETEVSGGGLRRGRRLGAQGQGGVGSGLRRRGVRNLRRFMEES